MRDKHGNTVVSVFRGMMPVFLAKLFPGERNGVGVGGLLCKSDSVRTLLFVLILTLRTGDSRDIQWRTRGGFGCSNPPPPEIPKALQKIVPNSTRL